MTSSHGRRWAAVGAVVLLTAVGCTGPTALGEHSAGVPAGSDGTVGVDALGVDAAGRVVVVTWGSSSCPRLPVRVGLDGSGRLQVTTGSSGGDCTTDLTPTTTTVPAPVDFDPTVGTALLDGADLTLSRF